MKIRFLSFMFAVLSLFPASWAAAQDLPRVPLPAGINMPAGFEAWMLESPYALGNMFFDAGGKAYIFSAERGTQKLIRTDQVGRVTTYAENDLLAGVNVKSGTPLNQINSEILMSVDGWSDGGNSYSGLFRLKPDSTFSSFATAQNHSGLADILPAPKAALFIPAPLPQGLTMPNGMSAAAARSNYTMGATGSVFFNDTGDLFAITYSENRKRIAKIDMAGNASVFADADILAGTNLKHGAALGASVLVAIDYAPEEAPYYGIHQIDPDGTSQAWRTNFGGLFDIIPAPGGGFYFSDFEANNVYFIADEATPETRLISSGAPSGLTFLAYDGQTGTLYALNRSNRGGEPWFGGENAIYKIEEGQAVKVANAPAGAYFEGIAFSGGGVFGNYLYATDSLGGRVFRIENDGAATPVITGLTFPETIRFDPVTGNMVVVFDRQHLIWFGSNAFALQPSAAAAGWYFTDFENDNVWYIPGAGQPEAGILESNIPPGLSMLAYNDTDDFLYSVNWTGGWPFGGDNSVYRIEGNGTAVAIAMGTPGTNGFSSIAMSKGGPFGNHLYATDSAGGRIVRLENTEGVWSVVPVITGLPTPSFLKFSPTTGEMIVVCNGGENVLWVGTTVPAELENLVVSVIGPKNVNPGQEVTFLVRYLNGMDITAENAVITVILPQFAQFVSCTESCLRINGELVWKIPAIASGDDGSILFKLYAPWGLNNITWNITARNDAANSPVGVIPDISDYIDAEDISFTDIKLLSEAEIQTLLSSGNYRALYDLLVSEGFADMKVAKRSVLSNGDIYIRHVFLKRNPYGAAEIWKYTHNDTMEDTFVIMRQKGLFEVEFFDREGGMSLNTQDSSYKLWGSWAEIDALSKNKILTHSKNNACGSCTFDRCVRICRWSSFRDGVANGVTDGLVVGLSAMTFSYVGGVYYTLSTARSAMQYLISGDEEYGRQFAIQAVNFPGAGSVHNLYQMWNCKKECEKTKDDCYSAYCCTKDAVKCSKTIAFGRIRLTCDTKSNQWTKMEAAVGCGAAEICKQVNSYETICEKECSSFPRSVNKTNALSVSGVKYDSKMCDDMETRIILAHDPNAKAVDFSGDVIPGQTLTYTIDYENVGAGTAYEVFILDQLDTDLNDSTLVINNGGTYSPGARLLSWDIGTLPPCTPENPNVCKGSVTFNVNVKNGLPSGTEIINYAEVHFPSAMEITPTNPVVNIVKSIAADPKSVETLSGTPVAIALTGRDTGANLLTYRITSGPLYGTISGTPPNITYTSMNEFSGQDEFYYVVNNRLIDSDPARVTVKVNPNPSDINPPTVISTYPSPGAVNVHVNPTPVSTNPDQYIPAITATFSEPIDSTTLTTTSFTVDGLTGNVYYDEVTRMASFIPSGPLSNSTPYTARLTTGIKDKVGNAMAPAYSWQFTTESLRNIHVTLSDNASELVFGEMFVNATSPEKIVSITSTGSENLILGSVGRTGAGSMDFAIAEDKCSGKTLSQFENCTVKVAFKPLSSGMKDAHLSVPSNDPDTSTFNVPLKGTGLIRRYLLTVSVSGTGGGSVTSTTPGISCSPDCTEEYDQDAPITLIAYPSIRSIFTGWSGDCSGKGECHVTMNSAKNVTAHFAYLPSHALPFFDDFSTDKGWFGYEVGGWERGPAQAGGGSFGSPDPEYDHTPFSEDNHLLGFVIGGDYPNNLPEKSIISPPIDCRGHDRIYLRFWGWLNVAGNAYDHARVYVSNDGANWTPIWENPDFPDITDSQGERFSFDISDVAANQETVYVKFTMGPTDDSIQFSGWNIDDLEVTSNPIDPPEGTLGTLFTIYGTDFGNKKGKVLVRKIAPKILEWTNERIDCLLSKAPVPGVYDIKVTPKVPKGALPIIFGAGFTVRSPEIDWIDPESGSAGDTITIYGKFFGKSKGKVYMGKKSCKVIKDGWWMDEFTGESAIVCVVPKKLVPSPYDIKVLNKIGSDICIGCFEIEY